MPSEIELYTWTRGREVEETVAVEGVWEDKVEDEECENGSKPDDA